MHMEGGRSAWLKAVMAAKKPGMSLGDAMKAAKKTYKKGGTLMGNMTPMGGRRRRGTRKAKVGGTAYGFTGGPYTGSDLPDGMSRWPSMSDATWQGPSELKGGRRRRSRRGGAFAPSTDGKPAQLPYAEPSVAPGTAVGVNGTFAKSGDVPAAFGGRRRRHTKKVSHRGGNQTIGSAMVYGAASSEAAAAARQAAAARNGYI